MKIKSKWFDCLCQDSQFKVSQHDFGHHLIFYNRMEIHFSTIINDAWLKRNVTVMRYTFLDFLAISWEKYIYGVSFFTVNLLTRRLKWVLLTSILLRIQFSSNISLGFDILKCANEFAHSGHYIFAKSIRMLGGAKMHIEK